jgi:hypothetical protein
VLGEVESLVFDVLGDTAAHEPIDHAGRSTTVTITENTRTNPPAFACSHQSDRPTKGLIHSAEESD